jgi:hypothetical protein
MICFWKMLNEMWESTQLDIFVLLLIMKRRPLFRNQDESGHMMHAMPDAQHAFL